LYSAGLSMPRAENACAGCRFARSGRRRRLWGRCGWAPGIGRRTRLLLSPRMVRRQRFLSNWPMRLAERVRLCPLANRASCAGVLTAAVSVHHNRLGQLAAHGDRHGQRGLDEIGAHVPIDGPADYPPRPAIRCRRLVSPICAPGSSARICGVPYTPSEAACDAANLLIQLVAATALGACRGHMPRATGRTQRDTSRS
jgi:hypothetical protein